MDAVELKQQLEESVEGWQPKDWLAMCNISQCPLKLYRDVVYGQRAPGPLARMMYHEVELHERDIKERLVKEGFALRQLGVVQAEDRRLRGEPDVAIANDRGPGLLLEVKAVSVSGFERVRWQGPMPDHEDQVQMYLRFGPWSSAWLIYKNRNTGGLWAFDIDEDEARGKRLEEKARRVLQAVDERRPPECECGRCES